MRGKSEKQSKGRDKNGKGGKIGKDGKRGKGGRSKTRGGDRDRDRDSEMGERRERPAEHLKEIDFRDTGTLRKFVTQQGKIMPGRITGATAAQQRKVAAAIRRARVLGLLP